MTRRSGLLCLSAALLAVSTGLSGQDRAARLARRRPPAATGRTTPPTSAARSTRRSIRSTPPTSSKLEVAWRFKTDILGPRPGVQARRHAARGQRRALHHRRHAALGRRARRQDRRTDLGAQPARRQARRRLAAAAVGPRSLLLDRRPRRRPHPLRHHRLSPGRAEREDRRADRRLRQERHRRPEGRRGVRRRAADRSRDRRDRPARHARDRQGRRRSSDRRSAKARRSARTTTPRAWCAPSTCAPASCCGRSTPFRGRANSATTPGRTTRGRSTATPACGRRSPSTKSSVSSICRSKRRRRITTAVIGPGNNLFAESLVCVDLQDRPAQVALPARAPSALELRHVVGADPRGHHRQRTSDQGRGGARQAGVPLRLRSRDRPAGVADRRAAGAASPTCRARRRARRSRSRRSRRPTRGNYLKLPDDLIDFTPELRAQAVEQIEALQGRAVDVQPADARQRQRHARRHQHGQRGRRHQLAGRRLRSRNAHRVRASEQRRHHVGIAGAAAAELLGHPLRVRRRRAAVPRSASARATAARPIRRGRSRRRSGATRRRGRAGASRPHAPPAAVAVAPAAGLTRRGPVDPQAAVRHDRRRQSRSRRDRLAGRARRHARQRPQSSGAEEA